MKLPGSFRKFQQELSRTFKKFPRCCRAPRGSKRGHMECRCAHGGAVVTIVGHCCPQACGPSISEVAGVFHGSGFSSTDRAQSVWLAQKSVFFPHGFLVFTAGPTFLLPLRRGLRAPSPRHYKISNVKNLGPCHVGWPLPRPCSRDGGGCHGAAPGASFLMFHGCMGRIFQVVVVA